jgi:superfamily II DNA/RNA helicase
MLHQPPRISPNVPARQVQRRVLPPANASMDVVLRSSTGSGKTLAFLLPALASASLALLPRRAAPLTRRASRRSDLDESIVHP